MLLAVCGAVWSVGTLLTASAYGAWLLLLGRPILGLSSGVVGPVSQCLVAEWTQPSGRGRAFGGAVASDAIGQSLAAAGLAWLIGVAHSWRSPLVALAAITAVFALGAWW